jgi:hypothetical protein
LVTSGAHCSHPVRGYFRANGELREPELSSGVLDATTGLAMQFEALIQRRASLGYLR